MNPTVSVIVPVYNVEQYLTQCLDSVLGQTLAGLEVICVDDGSTDGSPSLLKRYAASDARVRILRKVNGGLSSARNAGMEAARGRYIFFLDSDDWLCEANALEALVTVADAECLDLLFFEARILYEGEGSNFSIREDYYHRKASYPGAMPGHELFQSFVSHGDFRASACLILYRRDFLVQNKLSFPEGIIHEDDAFTPQCLALAQRAGCIPDACYARRVREQSITTATSRLRRAHGYCMGAQELKEFARNRLWGADRSFLRCFRARALDRVYGAGTLWLSAPPEERKAFLQALPASERSILQHWLRIGLPRARFRRMRKQLQSMLRHG